MHLDLLANINGEATEKALEDLFRKYRYYKLTTPDEFVPTITPRYTLEMPSFSSIPHSKTEAAAIRSVDFQIESRKFFERFNSSFYKLKKKQRQIILKLYLDEYPITRHELAKELHMSERTLYRQKTQALYALAIALGIAVYDEVSEN